MLYIFLFVMGVVSGGAVMFLFLSATRAYLKEKKTQMKAHGERLISAHKDNMAKAHELDLREAGVATKEHEATVRMDAREAGIVKKEEEIAARYVTYNELQNENLMLKRDLQNVDVDLRKLQLDRQLQQESQETLDTRANELGSRYLKENIKWIGATLNANNFVTCKQRLQKVIELCRGIGFAIPPEEEEGYHADLKREFEKAVRAAFEREEQARIKARIREEQMREREIDRELKQLDRERAAIQAALDKALAEASDRHSEEVDRLKARLAEAEERSRRAVSQAQLTKSGHVYVLSNIGAFGEGVFKIGLTRRLDPQERVKELGDASVPFPFDVHMMIACEDAPTLENVLHKAFHQKRVNKVNLRKEYFRSDIEAIRKVVQDNHGEVQYVADPEALEYRQSLTISDEDLEFIENVYEAAEEEHGGDEAQD